MKKINMHGLKIEGLRKAAKDSANGSRRYNLHMQINYNSDNGEVWASGPMTDGEYINFDDPAIFPVCETRTHMTMQAVADAISEAVADHEENQMSNLYIVERVTETRSYYHFKPKTTAGESLHVELVFSRDGGGKNSPPKLWHKNGWTPEQLRNWWSVTVYVTDAGDSCYSKYNPQVNQHGKIDFAWMFPATEENKKKLLGEIARRAGIKTED